ncbi:macrolide family glycosyltransferase [Actinokineospora sp. UTMC 2448]|uniref:macrolide family glycosyltransferase n=1 Tax=Actinokineospora sp. UTMC 2448 TaxID=2268449 RepID=UPI002164A1F8|nr:macrolide family glycosyltransferase [Actinokineospora sp. UTMC 2448]UVS76697.1 Oleandomycin glycosyltransferase [Actinokineospora sp. UTMC 2448]
MHLLFLCHPDHGHVIPNLAMVTELARRGHQVTYLTAASMAGIATDAGASVVTYESRYRDADFRKVAEDPGYLMDLLLDESAAMLAVDLPSRPDVLVYDTSILFAGRILARKLGVPSAQVIPVFASNEHFSYLNAMYNPGGAQEKPAEMPSWVMTTMRRIGELCAEHGVAVEPPQLWFEVPSLSLVTVPRDFQYAGETFDSRFVFVGPCVGDRGFLGSWEPPSSGLPVVLVSLGAVFNEHADFFRTCVEAFRGQPWHAVMTVAEGLDPAALGELPSNVEVHRWVPHVAVLEHASLCVTHGGMGTAMEALRAGTPMVCVPTSALDRPTARRIEELGLGVALDPATLSAAALVEAVGSVMGTASYAARAGEMAAAIAAAGGAARAADEIERA